MHLAIVSSFCTVLSIGPGTCRSSGRYSVESRRVYLTFKNYPERNSCGLLVLLRRVLFQGNHLLQILLKALFVVSFHLISSSDLFYMYDQQTELLRQ